MNRGLVFRNYPQAKKLRWWEKVWLFFLPGYWSVDVGKHVRFRMYFKYWRGSLWVVKEEKEYLDGE